MAVAGPGQRVGDLPDEADVAEVGHALLSVHPPDFDRDQHFVSIW